MGDDMEEMTIRYEHLDAFPNADTQWDEEEEFGCADDTADGPVMSVSMNDSSEEDNKFTLATAEETVTILSKHFQHVGGVIIKKNQDGTSFSHCGHGVDISRGYGELRLLMENHARLLLMKDCITRIHQFEMFLIHLKTLVQKETASWYAINHSKGVEIEKHQTNLTVLSPLCDEFRMHLNHWICIKQRIQNNRWLRPVLPSIIDEMLHIKNSLMKIQEAAFWWTERLLKTGMQVFAYVDRRTLTHNDVFSIVRGIEEFNTLVQIVRCQTEEMRASDFMGAGYPSHTMKFKLMQVSTLGAVDSSTTKSVSFLRLLHSLANEWAKSAVFSTLSFIDNHPDLYQAMHTLKLEKLQENDRPMSARSASSPVQTSDYYSDSHNSRLPCEVVDIMTHASPLLDFGKKEREYVGKVIQITCQRTTLLRKSKVPHTGDDTNKQSSHGDVPLFEEGVSSFNRNNPKRKSVSWGDCHDAHVRKQLLARYEDALWKAFGTKLSDSLRYEITWQHTPEGRTAIGCLDFLPAIAVTSLVHSVRFAAVKGYFSTGAILPILTTLGIVTNRTAGKSWDLNVVESLASMYSDKCAALLLSDGLKSTKTAMLLRNTLSVITNVLRTFVNQSSDDRDQFKGIPTQQKYFEYQVQSESVSKLLVTAEVCERWCKSKAHSLLTDYKVPAFILIVHGDLKMLLKGIDDSLLLLGETEHTRIGQIKALSARLERFYHTMCTKLSSKAAALTKQHITSAIPNRKVWKNTKDVVLPTNALPYAESLVDSLLESVCDGAQHLDNDNQIKAIESVLTSVCDAWTSYFTKHGIKFSLHGAYQLECDFGYLRNFLEVYVTNDDVKKQLFITSPMLKLQGIIELLKRQPLKSRSRNQVAPLDDRVLTDNARNRGTEGWNKILPSNDNEAINSVRHTRVEQNQILPVDQDRVTASSGQNNVLTFVSNKNAWLALRAKKPGQRSILPCLARNDDV